MSTASTDTFAAIVCTISVLNEAVSTSLETTSTASELRTPTQDIVDHMLHKCSPELVEHIFSFTTADHASAAGFFKHAISFLEKSLPDLLPGHHPSLLRYALRVGDLPMVRHLIFKNHPSCSTMSASDWEHCCRGKLWHASCLNLQFDDINTHAFMYMYHLIDCKASPLRDYIGIIGDLCHFFTELHQWATERNGIKWLDFLYRSTFSRNNQQAFAHWKTVASGRMMAILEYTHDHHYFGPNDTDIMNQILISKWGAGLEFCHVIAGKHFSRWDDTDLKILSDPRNSEVRTVMYKFCLFPEDMCPGCRDLWFPSIGYWGLVEVYKFNNRRQEHICSHFGQVLMCGNEPVSKIANSGWEYGDMHILRYLMESGSNHPLLWIFFKLLKKGDVKLLQSVCGRNERVVQLLYSLPLVQKDLFIRGILVAAAADNGETRVVFTGLDRAVLSHTEELDVEWNVLVQTLKWDKVMNLQTYLDKIRISNVLAEDDQALLQFW